MFDKETIIIVALAGLIIYILMSNKDEYVACAQNQSNAVPPSSYSMPSSIPSRFECNPIAGTGCEPVTKFAMDDKPMGLGVDFTGKVNPFAGPVNHIVTQPVPQFAYPTQFATKGSKMAMN